MSVTCGHFKTTTNNKLLIELEEEKKNLPEKPTKFPGPIPSTMSCHQYYPEITTERERKRRNLPKMLTKHENIKEKRKGKEEEPAPTTTVTYIPYPYTTLPLSNYY
ncbi:hypothetical protein G9A89_011826 [Geosiphon pyriformis]|nr:hypothetical protein G9A89_011826 [Geosiphon pyriformis]